VTSVELDARVHERILEHVRAVPAEEACGILVGRVEADFVRVRRALPCSNDAPPAERGRRFAIDPRAVLNVQRELRGSEQAIVGFYHSHPDGSAEPSRTDLDYIRLWPDTAWLIVGADAARPTGTRAWWLDSNAGPHPRELRITGTPVAHVERCPG
jgi:proteasome lid subunit RPN8/RPN11